MALDLTVDPQIRPQNNDRQESRDARSCIKIKTFHMSEDTEK